ncbi:MAG: S8 family serine peptidase, partial [Saccharothrix sp.]|nr:S8 family serine peptidase [Saccharothrix sp.]
MTARARRLASATLAAGLVVTTAAGVAGAAPERPRPDVGGTTVTLITGDRVVLRDGEAISVQPGPGRAGIGFHTFHRDGDLYVVPRDTTRPIAQGKLDFRLFDVTGLVEAGYDDAKRDTLPLIITGDGPGSGLRAARALPAVGAVAAHTAKAEAATTFQALVTDPGVEKIWLDGLRKPSLDRSTAQIGAPAAWQAGYTGEGVKVAVLDTGVDGAHPDLAGKVTAQQNFTDEPDDDLVGHGTHVAATIAGGNTKYRGVAPDADILDGKVCGVVGCPESAILTGMQWAVDQGADIVNLSLGGTDSPGTDPLEEAVGTLSAQALFVVAAGNSGRPGTIGSPGSADAALTVGAVDRDDSIAPFSSRGPRVGDSGVKPDVTAPGVAIAAAKSSTGQIGDPVDDQHVAESGTSMATPHVAGAAAIIAQQHPDWTGAQIKAALMASAKNNPALTAFDQGTGRVDLAKALTTTVTAQPASLAMGRQQWPHTDDTPVTKTLTYHNTGTEPVTLDLTVDTNAPTGMLTITPATITIPAGGQATATVTADTRVGTTDGAFSGTIKAGDTLRTPVSVEREVESYELTTTFLDANGQTPTTYSGIAIGMDNNTFEFLDEGAIRLPKGEYFLHTEISTGDPWTGPLALLTRPSLTLTGPAALTFDARAAGPLRIAPPDPDPTPVLSEFRVSRTYQGSLTSFGSLFFDGFGDRVSVGGLGPALPDDQFQLLVSTQEIGTPVGATPVHYRLAWLAHGQVPTGFVRAPAQRDLAEVRTRFGPAPAGHEVRHGAAPIAPDGSSPMGALFPVPAGGEAVDYLSGDGFRWRWLMSQWNAEGRSVADFSIEDSAYRDGRRHEERFNLPVFGPGLPPSRFDYLSRSQDRITVQVPLVNDSANHLGGFAAESARTALRRDGVLVGETDRLYGQFTVPPGEAAYRAEVDFVRAPGVSELSTRVTGAWTFRSDTVAGDQPRKLPLSVVRF